MSVIFADSSAIVKRYLITEVGANWVKHITRYSTGNIIAISELATVEVFSMLARRQREKTLTATDVQRISRTFLNHIRRNYLIVEVERSRLQTARRLLGRYKLRTLDAIQLSCALHIKGLLRKPITFISADNDLLTAAAGEGFTIDNPLRHP